MIARMTRVLELFAVTCLAETAAAARDKVAVFDIQTIGVDASLAPTLTEVLTAEVDALGRFDVVAGRDIGAMLGLDKQ